VVWHACEHAYERDRNQNQPESTLDLEWLAGSR